MTPLFEEDLVLVVPADHPLAGAGEISLKALEGIPLLLPLAGTTFRAELDAGGRPTGIELLARAEVDGTRLIASLTFEGWGPSILPATAVPTYLREQLCAREADRDPPAAHRRRAACDRPSLGTGTCRARAAFRDRPRPLEDSPRG